jgi:hypothetical protein
VEGFEVVVKKSSTTKNAGRNSADKPSVQQLSDLENEIAARLRALTLANVAAIRNVRREFSQRLIKSEAEFVIALALRLMRSVPRFVGYELIQHHKQARQSLTATTLEELGNGISSWEQVDSFASYLRDQLAGASCYQGSES